MYHDLGDATLELLAESLPGPQATLVDLLDRVLDKGLIIHADIIISVAGIPLIGVNLRAALAGMETMLEYGIMREWDTAIRVRNRQAEATTQAIGAGTSGR